MVVGQYHAIGLDMQGLSAAQLEALQTNLETTQNKLQAAETDPAALEGLTKHAIVGDLLQATVQSYLALNDVQDQLMAQAGSAVMQRMPSYGKFSTHLNPLYSWGVPKTVQFSGMMMDMDTMVSIVGTSNNDANQQKALVQQLGMRQSAMEHLVPEQMFSTDTAPAYGVSAVKAIQLAAAHGQKIYTINQANLESALTAINLNSSTEQEIRDAVNSGKVVTTHTHRVNFHGTVTAGYIIQDPVDGTGAYKIASGADGALVAALGFLATMFGALSLIAVGVGLLAPLITSVAIIGPAFALMALGISIVAALLTMVHFVAACNITIAGELSLLAFFSLAVLSALMATVSIIFKGLADDIAATATRIADFSSVLGAIGSGTTLEWSCD